MSRAQAFKASRDKVRADIVEQANIGLTQRSKAENQGPPSRSPPLSPELHAPAFVEDQHRDSETRNPFAKQSFKKVAMPGLRLDGIKGALEDDSRLEQERDEIRQREIRAEKQRQARMEREALEASTPYYAKVIIPHTN